MCLATRSELYFKSTAALLGTDSEQPLMLHACAICCQWCLHTLLWPDTTLGSVATGRVM